MLRLVLLAILCYTAISNGGYDASTAQFHPSGRILQTEYAKRTVQQRGGPVCAIKCSDGIFLSAARRVRNSKLILESTRKVFFVDRHVCIAVSGFVFEATQLIDLAKQECANFREIYNSPMPVENLCDYLSNVLHMLTRDGRYRPLGVSLVVAGWDEELGPQLFTTDPEGSFSGWNAVAIGSKATDINRNLADIMHMEDNGSRDTNTEEVRNGVKCARTVESVWPKFNSHILRKYFRHTTSAPAHTSGRGGAESAAPTQSDAPLVPEDEADHSEGDGDWISEVCIKVNVI